jgi:16S rRNA A1518/A1519 N6-dimethyltransferase RsmA/KsgA/DIM1 with predicted DNA glycosylase/AP lyase activity
MKSDRLPAKDRKGLLEFVKLCFAHKRKNLLNNLQSVYARQRVEAALAALQLPPTIRAEQLPFQEFAQLHARLREGH